MNLIFIYQLENPNNNLLFYFIYHGNNINHFKDQALSHLCSLSSGGRVYFCTGFHIVKQNELMILFLYVYQYTIYTYLQ